MASVFRQTYKRPIPPGAERVTRRGQRVARWKDKRGRTQTAPLSEDGTQIVLEYSCWYIAYVDGTGQRVIAKGFTDREATEQKARDVEKQAARSASGIVVVDPDKTRALVSEALGAYLQDLERLGRDDVYRYNIRKMMEKLAKECSWPTLASIRPDAMRRWLAEMAKDSKETKDGKPVRQARAPRTLNEYLSTAQTFLEWCIGQNYLEGNPLSRIERADESDKRRMRRALHPEEMQRFLHEAGVRRDIYLTAALSGLRRKELRLLQWGDVILDGDFPHIQLRAKATKARRADVLPLNPELRELLTSIRPADATASTPVFATIPTRRTYKRDLKRAGIPYKDEQGRQADFHALRMAFGTYLQRAGVPIRTAMQLMRHSDIRLTANIYTDATLLDTAGAVGKLPRLGKTPEESRNEKPPQSAAS
jgi:integrase